jgi:hypothetical protein
LLGGCDKSRARRLAEHFALNGVTATC